jgi:hypothetical protein
MAGTIKQITQRLAALDQDIEALGQAFYDTYHGYLTQLGQAVRKQIIQASYQICTENYPKRFLNLPVSRRQKLQEDLQALSRQVETQLLGTLCLIADMLAESDPSEDPDELEALFSKVNAQKSEAPTLNPLEALAEWQDQLERAIAATLKSTASTANHLLQDAEILPKRVPQPIPESAPKSAETEEENPDAADLLSLLVENSDRVAELQKSPQLAAMLMQTTGVNLRLSEIEFNTPTVMSWRNKLRELKRQFQTLGQEYQKKLREQAIVEAQLAWKSTWVKDE